MRSYRTAEQQAGTVFLDRGVPDVAGYLRLMKLPVPEHVKKATEIFRYHARVLIAPPWEEIFRQDRERTQDFGEAVRTYEALASTYAELEYQLVELPRAGVEARVQFVRETLDSV